MGVFMSEDPIKRAVLLILYQSQQDQADELVISPAVAGGVPVRYKVRGTWHDWKSPGPNLSSSLVAEIERLAAFRDGPYPQEGNIDVAFPDTRGTVVRLRWKVGRASAGAPCILTPA